MRRTLVQANAGMGPTIIIISRSHFNARLLGFVPVQ